MGSPFLNTLAEESTATTLERLDLPTPLWRIIPYYPTEEETIVTPCFEQLIGAWYALLKSELSGYKVPIEVVRDHEVLFKSLSQIAQSNVVTDNYWKAWESGFYFNTSLHRVVWACERLLKIFACLPLKCGEKEKDLKKNIQEVIRAADNRRQELSCPFELSGIKEAIEGFSEITPSDTHVTPNNFLTLLQWRVNQQKHTLRRLYEGQITHSSVQASLWNELDDDHRFRCLQKGLQVASKAYREVHNLYFKERVLWAPNP